ncbi:hypothetical protein [Pseudopontixanthobacter vadosimaris]|uniref:hypothetical protein n=1 Tax=Pseudopontixanthobacter vadosimaris TaxID=2726450 RepID=UPI001475B15B|nr:hypothetical protein [Pseudopontixanthobacter vadosimaris]
MTVMIIALLLVALLVLRRSRRTEDAGKAKMLRRTALALAVLALIVAIVDAADMALDHADEEVPTLTGDRLP